MVAVSAELRALPTKQKTLLVSNITIDSDSWSGATSTSNPPASASANVHWSLESSDNGISLYRASGSVHGAFAIADCTMAPDTVAIDPAFSYLAINYNNDPPTYDGVGTMEWSVTFTCPDADEPIPGSIAVLWFDAVGALKNNGTVIGGNGASRDGRWQQGWSFTRDE